ncbi:MAG: methyl-accepting chemotaxis protein [Thermodesulfovibrionales bacterium]
MQRRTPLPAFLGKAVSSIRARVLLSFTVITVVLIAGSLGGYMAKEKNAKLKRIVDSAHEQQKLYELVTRKSLEYVILEGQRDVRESITRNLAKIDEIHSALSGERASLGVEALRGQERAVLDEIGGKYQALRSHIEELLAMDQEVITVEDGDLLLLLGDIILDNKALEPSIQKLIEGLNVRARKANTVTLWIFFGATLLATVISVVAIIGGRAIAARFDEMRDGLRRLREADLTRGVEVGAGDELGEIGASINSVMENLSAVLKDAQEAAQYLASTSEELSATCSGAVQEATEKTDRLTKVSAAMQEMGATVVDMARNAADAAGASRHSTEITVQGKGKMDDLLGKMSGIESIVSESSKLISDLNAKTGNIVDIVDAINDIADQTNLLALNAAIEAARAGEQGRGFAVVADEVRKLAERTVTLTAEIGSTIKGVEQATRRVVKSMESEVDAVQRGVELAHETGAYLREIEKNVGDISLRIDHIATASEEHSTVSEEIASDLETISSITRRNTESVRHISSAASEMSGLASRLQTMVRRFKLEQERP